MRARHRQLVGAVFSLLVAAACTLATGAHAAPLEVELGYQVRAFGERGATTQDRVQQNLRLRVQGDGASGDGRWQWHVDAHGRIDDMDARRSGADLREAYVRWIGDGAEVTVGARRVFWGVTEFVHLVDVINQSDLVENLDEEDRLGQPMLQLELPRDAWNLQLYLLPGLRSRTFGGPDGRQHGGAPPRGDVEYAPSLHGEDLSMAARIEWHADGLDVGLAHFSGAGREPVFLPMPDGRPRARHEHIEQTSLDLSWLAGDWLWKLEGYRRAGQGDTYVAASAGFERTWVGLVGRADVGWVVEYLHDQRGHDAPLGHYDHDVALGLRVAANDVADTSVLLGWIQDLREDEHSFSLEASSRLAERLSLQVEARVFGGHVRGATSHGATLNALFDPDNKTGFLDQDDYVQLELTTFF